MRTETKTLLDLPRGQTATVIGFGGDADVVTLLREIGFAEDDEVEVLGVGPLGRSPLSVRLNRTVIALRRNEAASIQVRPRS